MTGPDPEAEGSETRPISVAELLARNGTIGAPAVSRRRRRRRGDSDAVSVAELTGELPVIRDLGKEQDEGRGQPPEAAATDGTAGRVAYWSEPEPRWPKSPPQAQRSGPELSAYPRPRNGSLEPLVPESDAEGMSPDPAGDYVDSPVDVMDSDVREAEVATEDSAYVRSYLQASDSASSNSTLFGGPSLADELARRRGDQAAQVAEAAEPARPVEAGEQAHPSPGRFEALWRASLVVLQSILAVVFGAGLFVAFDQLWRWNNIVALVLSVLVILGLVVGVRVVRKTEDIASTLIAVAVGALITLGPLALSLQSGRQ